MALKRRRTHHALSVVVVFANTMQKQGFICIIVIAEERYCLGHEIRAGCSQSVVWLEYRRLAWTGACRENTHIQAFRLPEGRWRLALPYLGYTSFLALPIFSLALDCLCWIWDLCHDLPYGLRLIHDKARGVRFIWEYDGECTAVHRYADSVISRDEADIIILVK